MPDNDKDQKKQDAFSVWGNTPTAKPINKPQTQPKQKAKSNDAFDVWNEDTSTAPIEVKKKDGSQDYGAPSAPIQSQSVSKEVNVNIEQPKPKTQTKKELSMQVRQLINDNYQNIVTQTAKDKIDFKPLLQGVDSGDPASITALRKRITQGYQKQIDAIQNSNQVSAIGGGGGSFGGMSVSIQGVESPEQKQQIDLLNQKIQKTNETLNKYLTFSMASVSKKAANGKVEHIDPVSFGKKISEQIGDDAEVMTDRLAKKSHTYEGQIANQNLDYKHSQIGLSALIEETQSDYAQLQDQAKVDPSLNKQLEQKKRELNYLYNSYDNLLDRYPQVALQNVSSVIGDEISKQKNFWNIGTYTSKDDINKAVDEIAKNNPQFVQRFGKYIDQVRQSPSLVQDRGLLGAAKVATGEIGRYFQRQFNTDEDAAAMRVADESRTSLRPTALSGGSPNKIILGDEGKSFIPVSNKENFGHLNWNNTMRFIGSAVPDVAEFVGVEAATAGVGGLVLEVARGAQVAERIGGVLGVTKNLYRGVEEIEAAQTALKAQKALIGNAAAFYLTSYEPNLRYAESLIKEDTPEADTKRAFLANFLTLGQIVSFKIAGTSPSKLLQRSITKGAADDAMKFLEKRGFEGITKEETYKAISEAFVPRMKAVAGQLAEVGKEGGKMALAGALSTAFKDIGSRVTDPTKGLSFDEYKDASVTGALQGVFFSGVLRTPQIAEKFLSNPNVDALHEAALNSEKYIQQINEAVNDGRMNRPDANDIISSIKTANEILNDPTKFTDKNGHPLNDRSSAKVLANEFIKSASNLIADKEVADIQRNEAQKRIDEIKAQPNWVNIDETPIIKDLKVKDENGAKVESFNDIDAAAKYQVEGKEKPISGAQLIEEINNKVNDYNHEEVKVPESETTTREENKGENAESKEEESVTPEQQQEDKVTVGDMLDKKGTYNGDRGTFVQEGQTIEFHTDKGDRIYELGNIDEIKDASIRDYSIQQEESVVKLNEDGIIESRGKKYTNPNEGEPLKAIRRNKEGDITGVTLHDEKGREVTFRGQRAEDLAYQLILNEITKDNENRTRFEDFINTDEGIKQEIDNAGFSEVTEEPATKDNAEVQRTKLEPKAGLEPISETSKISENERKNKGSRKESSEKIGKEESSQKDGEKNDVTQKEGAETPQEAPPLKKEEINKHAQGIKNKFKDQFSKKGVPDEHIDAAVALMDARAKSWASEEKGRTPEEWYQQIADIKNGEFENENKVKYQLFDNDELIKDEKGKVIGVKDEVLNKIEEERNKIETEAKDKGEYLKAPNGEHTKLSPKDWVTVRTDRFKNWFGDWEKDPRNSSKIVDDNGEPLIMYHGSDSKHEIFDRKKIDKSNTGTAKGFHFSSSKYDLKRYGKNIYSAFLDVRNPKRIFSDSQLQTEVITKDMDGVIQRFDKGERGSAADVVVYNPNQIKSADNIGSFSVETDNIKFQERKGALETLKDGRMVIHALEKPDFSTMVHEIGHVFEKDLTESEQKTVKDFGGSEAFARGFERYLRDGKAPSEPLKGLFDKFKDWLTNIYQSLKGSPISKKVSPEIKQIFDRLLTEKNDLTKSEEVQVSDKNNPKEAAQAYLDSAARLREQGDEEGAKKLEEAAKNVGKDTKPEEIPLENISDPETTKMANAINDAHIEGKFGREALDKVLGKLEDTSLKNIYEKVKNKIERGVIDLNKMRERLLTTKEGTEEDQAALLYDLADLKGKESALISDINTEIDPSKKEQLQKQLLSVQNDMMDNALANRNLGRTASTIFRLRQLWVNREKSLVDFQEEFKASNGGKELTSKQEKQVRDAYLKIRELKEKAEEAKRDLDKSVAENERLRKEKDKLDKLQKEITSQRKLDRGKKSDEIIKKSQERVEKAREELRKTRGDLNVGINPKAVIAIGKIAAEKVYQGIVKFDELVKNVLDDVKDIFPHWTEEDVRQHLLPQTNTEKYYDSIDTFKASNKDLKEKIDAYRKLQKDYAVQMFKWQKERRSDMMKNMPFKDKVVDSVLRWQRFAVLSYPSTFIKLLAVVGQQVALKPLKFLIQAGVGKVTEMASKGVSEKQVLWGTPTASALGKYYSALVRNFSLANLKENFSGIDTKEILYGKGMMYDEWAAAKGLLELPGRSHGYIKSFIKNPEFQYAHEQITSRYIANMERIAAKLKTDDNHKIFSAEERKRLEEEYEKYDVTNEDNMEQVNKLALEHGKWAILMNDNNFVEKFQKFTRDTGIVGAAIKSELPVVKIPVNYVSRAFATKYGLIKAITGSKWYGGDTPSIIKIMYRGSEGLTTKQADLLGKTLTLGTMGASFFALGYMGRNNIHKNEDGSYDVFGVHVKSNLVHSPEIESILSGAETGNEYDKKDDKDAKDWITSFLKADADIVAKSPFASMLKYGFLANMSAALTTNKDMDKKVVDAVGKKVADMVVPGFVKQTATAGDVEEGGFDPFGKTIKRRPDRDASDLERFWQRIELSIPGLRQNVPEQ